ncbi:MAG TPA: tetratricopeptide repeat protein [Geobacteraceae bacterium]
MNPKKMWETNYFPYLLILIAGICVYARALGYGFLFYDDPKYVLQNDLITNVTWEKLVKIFTEPYFGNYAPLHILSYALDNALWGKTAGFYIAENILLHLMNALLLSALVTRMVGDRRVSLLAGLIFVLHPVNVESVVWISERKNVLGLFFFLGSFLAYLVADEEESRGYYALSLVLFLLSMLSKSAGVMLPFVIALHGFLLRGKGLRKSILIALPWLAIAVAAVAATVIAQSPEHEGGRVPYQFRTFWGTVWTMLPVLVRYLRMVVWPSGLSAYYYPEHHFAPDASTALSLALLALVALLLRYLHRKDRRYLFFAGIFFLNLLPVMQIIPLITVMNDRYLYFPLVGGAPFLAMLLASVPMPLSPKRWAQGALLSILGIACFLRVGCWKNDVTLWEDAMAKSPTNLRALALLEMAYITEKNYPAAYRWVTRGLALDPDNPDFLDLAGMYYVGTGDTGKAAFYYRRLVDRYPDNKKGWLKLGANLYRSGNNRDAEEAYRRALSLDPAATDAMIGLGNLSLDGGRVAEARAYFEEALQGAPRGTRPGILYSLGCIEARGGRHTEAISLLRQAVGEGFNDVVSLEKNPDLLPLAGYPEYQALLAQARRGLSR